MRVGSNLKKKILQKNRYQVNHMPSVGCSFILSTKKKWREFFMFHSENWVLWEVYEDKKFVWSSWNFFLLDLFVAWRTRRSWRRRHRTRTILQSSVFPVRCRSLQDPLDVWSGRKLIRVTSRDTHGKSHVNYPCKIDLIPASGPRDDS